MSESISQTSQPKSILSPRRLWFPVALVLLYWAATIIMRQLDKPYFIAFMFGMISAALLALPFFIWWWFNRSLSRSDRSFAFFTVIGLGILAVPLVHRSVGPFGLATFGLPVVITLWTLWMVVHKKVTIPSPRLCFFLIMLLAWSAFLPMRVDGLDSDLKPTFSWRWQPTAEEQFLSESTASAPLANPNALADWKPTVTAADWTEFRGPDRAGVVHAPELATDWKSHPPRLVWKHKVGPAWSSVIVVNNRLFTQEQRGDQEVVVCYDADNGKELWRHEDPARFWEGVSGAGPRATPTFAQNRLFTVGGTGILNCLDPATGKRLWTQNITDAAGAQPPIKPPMWGYSSSPLVFDDLVIVYAGGDAAKSLLAYRIASGELAWSAPAGLNSYSSPQITTVDGLPQCLILCDHGLASIDPRTGKELWKAGTPWPGAPRTVQPHQITSSQLLVGTLEGTGGLTLLDVKRQADAWKVETLWSSKDLKPEFPDMVVHQGHVYGFDINIFCCVDIATGKRAWKAGRYGRGQVMLLPEQSLLLIASETGDLVLLKADPKQHQELGRIKALSGKTWNHPVIAHGKIYVRNDEEMACYDLPTRQQP